MKYNLKKLDYKKQIDLLELACDCSEHADALYTLREWFEGFEKELRLDLKRLNIVHEKKTCVICDNFREYAACIKAVLGDSE